MQATLLQCKDQEDQVGHLREPQEPALKIGYLSKDSLQEISSIIQFLITPQLLATQMIKLKPKAILRTLV